MNRHQSNPFLAGWETTSDPTSRLQEALDNNQPTTVDENSSSNETTTRRHSSSQADASGNPFDLQRQSTDRRLYLRNMSSFEAASLQLERQNLRENGTSDQAGDQTELIAKMTAEFQSAIETNDKQFGTGENHNDMLNYNPFDPFETIVDDDVSLPSPSPSLSQGTRTKNDDHSMSDTVENSGQKIQDVHDSIDDDDAELLSTPVRTIKSSPHQITADFISDNADLVAKVPDHQGPNQNCTYEKNIQQVDNSTENFNSIEKASLYASLLDTAESNAQQNYSNTIVSESDVDTAVTTNVEQATRIIKGSHSNRDGNSDRPIGFFDPFETVIDKDALTSLMNETRQSSSRESETKLECTTPKTPEPTPIHLSHQYQEEDPIAHLQRDNAERTGLIAGSISAETVIEHSLDKPDEIKPKLEPVNVESGKEDTSNLELAKNYEIALPRPQKSSNDPRLANQIQESVPLTTSTKKQTKQKKKSLSNEDSSESSEEENRIQIIIKAREIDQNETKSVPGLVPLLPPPPSKSSMKQARGRGQVQDMPSPVMSYKSRGEKKNANDLKASSFEESDEDAIGLQKDQRVDSANNDSKISSKTRENVSEFDEEERNEHDDQFVIPMTHSDDDLDTYGKPETPLYDEDTSYVLEDFPAKYEGSGWDMMLRYPPKKKLTSNRFWKRIFVKLAQVPIAPDSKTKSTQVDEVPQTCIALQIFDKPDDKKAMQEIPIQATYTVSEISSQQLDQFGKIFTIKLQYIFYKERVGVRQGQIARFIHTGHIGSSTTSGGHGVDPISIGAIKRVGAPIEHSPQISQIIKLGCVNYDDIRHFKNCLEDYLFKMPIHRDRALSTYKTEEVQMAVRDETYIELNQVGTIIRQLARVRLFFLSFLNGTPTIEVGINAMERQGREVVGRMDILPVVTEEWIRLEAWDLHSTVDKEQFENPDSRIIALIPPDATFFELMRFRVRPPRNRELPLQVSADMSVTRTKVTINCEVMVPGCVSRKHGQIPCENIAIRIYIPECWIYFFREEKHFRMGSKKSVNRRPGKVKGIERFLGGGGLQDLNDETSLIEVTSGQAKYEHHHHAIVWRAARWPKESQSAYVQNTMKIRLPLTAYDKMPENFYEYIHVEYTMPATTVSHTTLRSISVNPCDDEPPEKYVKYSAKYEYKVKMRQSINMGTKSTDSHLEASPIVIMKQPDLQGHLQREEDSDDGSDDEDVISDQGEGQC